MHFERNSSSRRTAFRCRLPLKAPHPVTGVILVKRLNMRPSAQRPPTHTMVINTIYRNAPKHIAVPVCAPVMDRFSCDRVYRQLPPVLQRKPLETLGIFPVL